MLNCSAINLVILSMCTNESDVQHTTNKNDNCYYAVVITANIEHITAIFNIVCRREHPLQVCMTLPLCSLNILYPFIQWLNGIGMRLDKVV